MINLSELMNMFRGKREKGSALVYVLMAILLLSVLITATFSLSAQSVSSMHRTQMEVQTRYSAEAGLEKAVWVLEQAENPLDVLVAKVLSGGIFLPEEQLPLSAAGYTTTFSVKVEQIVPGKEYKLLATGKSIDVGTVETTVSRRLLFAASPFSELSSDLFKYGLIAAGNADQKGTLNLNNGYFWFQQDFDVKGDVLIKDATLWPDVTIQDTSRPNGRKPKKGQGTITLDNVTVKQPPDMNIEAEMNLLYQRLLQMDNSTDEIYISDKPVTIKREEVRNGIWYNNQQGFTIIVAPKINLDKNLSLGTKEKPVLLFAMDDKGATGALKADDLTIYGFLLGGNIDLNKKDNIFGGVVSNNDLSFKDEATIDYSAQAGQSFTEINNGETP